jgi:hypothetical protein
VAPARVNRWCKAWGLSRTPAAVAVCASAAPLAAGFASQPHTRVWTNAAPLSFERRCVKPLGRAAASAAVCKAWRNASVTCGIVTMGRASGR